MSEQELEVTETELDEDARTPRLKPLKSPRLSLLRPIPKATPMPKPTDEGDDD